MARCIDADALFKTVNRLFYSAFEVGSKESEKGRFRRGYNVAITDACEAITAAPTLSPDDVRGVGEWIPLNYSDEFYGDMYQCSNCGGQTIGEPDYCECCGARMKGAEDGTTE